MKEGELRVDFDGREVTYGFGELDELVPAPSAFASRNVSAGNSGTPGYLQDDPSIQQPLSGSAGDLIDHAGVRSRCVAPSPSTAWRRASRRALRCGQRACAWKWR